MKITYQAVFHCKNGHKNVVELLKHDISPREYMKKMSDEKFKRTKCNYCSEKPLFLSVVKEKQNEKINA